MTAADWIGRIWRIYASLCGAAVISLGIAFGIVSAMTREQPIVERATNLRVETEVIPPNGTLIYSFDVKRNEACPGTVIHTYTLTGVESPAIVTVRRPVQDLTVKTFIGVRLATPIPPAVGPGVWRLQSVIDSICSTRQRLDPLLTFNFEVRENPAGEE